MQIGSYQLCQGLLKKSFCELRPSCLFFGHASRQHRRQQAFSSKLVSDSHAQAHPSTKLVLVSEVEKHLQVHLRRSHDRKQMVLKKRSGNHRIRDWLPTISFGEPQLQSMLSGAASRSHTGTFHFWQVRCHHNWPRQRSQEKHVWEQNNHKLFEEAPFQ